MCVKFQRLIEARIVLPLCHEHPGAFRAGEARVLAEFDGFKLLQAERDMAKRADGTKHGALLEHWYFIQYSARCNTVWIWNSLLGS